MRCRCGKMEIDEPVICNDYQHEPLDMPGGFCGPVKHHTIRDLQAEVKNKQEQIEKVCKDNTRYAKALRRIMTMAGNQDAAEACRLIIKEAKKVLDGKLVEEMDQ